MSDDQSFNRYRGRENQKPLEFTLGDDAELLISARKILYRKYCAPAERLYSYRRDGRFCRGRKETFQAAIISLIALSAVLVIMFTVSGLLLPLLVMAILMIAGLTLLPVLAKHRHFGLVNIEVIWLVNQLCLRRRRWTKMDNSRLYYRNHVPSWIRTGIQLCGSW